MPPLMPTDSLLVITGPTGSGKSALALELAARLNGEIVSVDSMQIYRECDIVTAKPTPAERDQIPHHLLDIRDPDQRYSAGEFARDAMVTIATIRERGRCPILCGGTGFYLRALLQPESLPAAAGDDEMGARLEAELRRDGKGAMHGRLSELNAAAAARIHPNDSYRVLRALEIALTGSPQNSTSADAQPLPAHVFALDWPREALYKRLEERVDNMLQAGALEELRTLTQKWGATAPALGGVGYKQLMPVLENSAALPDAIEGWKRDTRRYAKRQLTWFRHQMEVEWLDAGRPLPSLCDHVIRRIGDLDAASNH